MKQKNRVYIIAEAGVNHNGSLETAKRLIDAAAASGAGGFGEGIRVGKVRRITGDKLWMCC
jgi:hypothetical protein